MILLRKIAKEIRLLCKYLHRYANIALESFRFSFPIGKTVSYLLPLVHHLREPRNKKGFRGLIVSPTRELANQIYRECLKLCHPRKLRPFMIDKVAKSAKKISGQKLDILVTTPNRLVYMINNDEISLKNVEWLIVDESDKLFEAVGKGESSFRDQLASIYRYLFFVGNNERCFIGSQFITPHA